MSTAFKVLVVDDEPIVRMDIADSLEEAGFSVVEAHNAEAAIAGLEMDLTIRLIFTDIDMPGSMNGLMLAASVADRWPPIRIIITSGHRMVDQSEIPEGSLFFPKPYLHREVVASINSMLRQ